jgi:hypothetical protein
MQLGFEYRKKLRETTINAKVEVANEFAHAMDNPGFIDRVKDQVKEKIFLSLDPFIEYERQDQPEFNQYEIIGRVRLCRVGHWEEIPATMTKSIYHRCSICQTRAEEDDKGDELITPFCPYCGAYMKNAGEIIAKRIGGKEAKS